MKIERLINDIPTGEELQEAWTSGRITEAEYYNKMSIYAGMEMDEVAEWYGFGELYAIGSRGHYYIAELSELFDLIVEKDLSYLAKADGVPAIIRTDDGEVFKLYNAETVQAILTGYAFEKPYFFSTEA